VNGLIKRKPKIIPVKKHDIDIGYNAIIPKVLVVPVESGKEVTKVEPAHTLWKVDVGNTNSTKSIKVPFAKVEILLRLGI